MAGLADMLDSMLRVVAGGQANSDAKADLNAATDHTADENYSQCARVWILAQFETGSKFENLFGKGNRIQVL